MDTNKKIQIRIDEMNKIAAELKQTDLSKLSDGLSELSYLKREIHELLCAKTEKDAVDKARAMLEAGFSIDGIIIGDVIIRVQGDGTIRSEIRDGIDF